MEPLGLKEPLEYQTLSMESPTKNNPIISCEKLPLILHSQTINTKIFHDWTTVKSGADNSPTKSDTKSVTKVTLNLKEVVVGIMIGNDL